METRNISGPDSSSGRASASGAGDRRCSKPGRAIPKALKMVPVATLLGAQHCKASTGFSHSLLTQLTLHKKQNKKKKLTPSTWFTGTRLMSPSGVKTYRKIV